MTTKRLAFPIFLAGSAVLSAGPLFVRLADVGAVQSAFWRLLLALPALVLLAKFMPGSSSPSAVASSRRQRWTWLLAAGFFFAADLATWHLGIKRTTMANSALLANGASFFFPVWGYLAMRRWPTRKAAAAMLIALAGAVLLMGLSARLGARHVAGDALCVVAALCYTGYLVVMDKVRGGLAVWPALAASTLFSTILLLPVALLSKGEFRPHDWTPLLCLALGSQVLGQGLTILALPYLSPLATGLGLLIQPVLTAVIGWLWFGETLGPGETLGMSMILAALVLVRLPDRRAPAQPVAPPPQE